MGWRSPCSSKAVTQIVHSEWECRIRSFENHAPIQFIQDGDLARWSFSSTPCATQPV